MTTRNAFLEAWVEEVARQTRPDHLYWCDGSREEYDRLVAQMLETGALPFATLEFPSEADAEAALDAGEIVAALVIPATFSAEVDGTSVGTRRKRSGISISWNSLSPSSAPSR